MRLLLTCKETTRLVLEGEDRTLPLGERVLYTSTSACARAAPAFPGRCG